VVPRIPNMTSHNSAEEPWRLIRLARLDGRLREMMRMLTSELDEAVGPVGELVWSRYVETLHDDRGTLFVDVASYLEDSPWLVVIAAALQRAWDGEDESSIVFRFPGGNQATIEVVLPPPPFAAL
jgi:hypothetical protein